MRPVRNLRYCDVRCFIGKKMATYLHDTIRIYQWTDQRSRVFTSTSTLYLSTARIIKKLQAAKNTRNRLPFMSLHTAWLWRVKVQ